MQTMILMKLTSVCESQKWETPTPTPLHPPFYFPGLHNILLLKNDPCDNIQALDLLKCKIGITCSFYELH